MYRQNGGKKKKTTTHACRGETLGVNEIRELELGGVLPAPRNETERYREASDACMSQSQLLFH